VAVSPLISSTNGAPPISLGKTSSTSFCSLESFPLNAAPNCFHFPDTTRRALPPSLAKLRGFMSACEKLFTRSSTKKPCHPSGSSRSMRFCALPKATTNFSSKTANGVWNLSPARVVSIGSSPPSRAQLLNLSQKVPAPAFASAPTLRAGSFSMITRAPGAGDGARCLVAATAIRLPLFPGGIPQAAASKHLPATAKFTCLL
jgi:hypothetical protein